MNASADTSIQLENKTSNVTIDLFGGAITSFLLKSNAVNPLSFAFTQAQMPENNRHGAPYRGHFLCLGRWGLPSAGEIKMGVPNHGEAANVLWQMASNNQRQLCMQATAPLEGLQVIRRLTLDEEQPLFIVKETVLNTHSLGRPCNIVQHPTLAAPFLDAHTLIDCNAAAGFDQAMYKNAEANTIQWPIAKDNKGSHFHLRNPAIPYNAVFSFIIQPRAKWGWITAYSPAHQLLLGYVWKRQDYPWIHLWQHWNEHTIQYRGIEFGTAGIHQPFKEILDTAVELFGEKTMAYIDAGEAVSKTYVCFLQEMEKDCTGVADIQITDGCLKIQPIAKPAIIIQLPNYLLHELS